MSLCDLGSPLKVVILTEDKSRNITDKVDGFLKRGKNMDKTDLGGHHCDRHKYKAKACSLLPSEASQTIIAKSVSHKTVTHFLATAEKYCHDVAPLWKGLETAKKFERILQVCFQKFLLLKCLINVIGQYEKNESVLNMLTENLGDISEYVICEGVLICQKWEASEVSKVLTNHINNTGTVLRTALMTRYSLEKLVAHLMPEKGNRFELWMYTTAVGKKQAVQSDVQTKEMEHFIMSFSHKIPTKASWNCHIALLDVPVQLETNFDSGFVDYKKDRSVKHETCSLKSDIFMAIKTKDVPAYQFWTLLLRYKDSGLPVKDLISEEGLNILQLSLDQGKLTFLQSIFCTGWWSLLSQQKVPDWGLPEYRGKTAKAIAESKRARKALEEYNNLCLLDKSMSPLMKAIRINDKSMARSLMKTSPEELFYLDNNKANALYWAIVSGAFDILTELLQLGVDYSMVTNKKESLLHVACLFGKSEFVPELVKRCKVDVLMEDTSHKTAIDRVAENGDLKTLEVFIDCGIQPKPTSLVLSAFTGRLPFVMHCVDILHMDINSADMYGRTVLQRACEGRQTLVAMYLLPKGVDLTMSTCTNKNIIHFLAEAGDFELTKLILQKMSKPDILKLINQQERYHGEPLCFLIRGSDKGREAWHYVEVERIKVPIFLKKTKSGNVDVASFGTVVKSGWGANPSPDDIEYIEVLFKTRKFDTSSDADVTPLHLAAFKGHSQIATLLLDYGANVNAKDIFGNTAVMIAASRGDKDMILELERRGANLQALNNKRMSAIDIADENEQDDVIHLMKGHKISSLSGGFLENTLQSVENGLSADKLNEIRQSGQDVRRHIIDTLRDLRIGVNQFLVDVGSGPVLEATD